MKAVGYDADARTELDDALDASSDPAAFRRAVEEALQDIASGFRTHARYGRTAARQCPLAPLPYSIIYTETDDTVKVVAVSHNRRRPGYWKRRLGRP